MTSLSKIWKIISAVLSAAILILALLLVGVRLVRITPYVVLSGSMEPTYHVGSVIYDKKADPSKIVVGTPITFHFKDSSTLVTHRVVAISEDGEYYTTQGDANDAQDGSPVYCKNVVGIPVFSIPLLGFFSNWISQKPGMYVGIAFLAVLIIFMFLPDLLKKEGATEECVRNTEAKSAGAKR